MLRFGLTHSCRAWGSPSFTPRAHSAPCCHQEGHTARECPQHQPPGSVPRQGPAPSGEEADGTFSPAPLSCTGPRPFLLPHQLLRALPWEAGGCLLGVLRLLGRRALQRLWCEFPKTSRTTQSTTVTGVPWPVPSLSPAVFACSPLPPGLGCSAGCGGSSGGFLGSR